MRGRRGAPLGRREVLKGMLGGAVVTIGLPVLDLFLPSSHAYADCGAFPKRFGWWFWGNGALPASFNPATEGPAWTPSEQLMPMLPLRDKITVVTGTRVMTPNTNPHGSGPAGLFSGDDLTGGDEGIARTGTFWQPSIDQIIANAIGDATRFRSLEVGVQRGVGGLSHSGPSAVNPPETSPAALFERLFGAGFRAPGDTTGPDPRLALRRSVLDGVIGQAGQLRGRLGARDRQRLDQHLDGVRRIELQIQRLEADPPDLAACMLPGAPAADYPDVMGRPQMSAVSRVMSDLVAMALACDQTRVFSVMFSGSVSNILYGAATAGHHQLTHDEPGAQPQVNTIVTSIMEELAYFFGALDAIPEGDGTLLDHSLVLGTTDCSFGRTHAIDDYPILLAGGGCDSIVRGVHHRSRGDNATKVSLSLIRAMDVPLAEFGRNAGRSTDGLGAIEP